MKGNGLGVNPATWFRARDGIDPNDEDQTPLEDRIPTSWWTGGLFLSTVMCCAILATQFKMNVGEALLALILGFLFSFIGVQSSGHTDVNPISTVAKVKKIPYQNIPVTSSEYIYNRLPNLFSGASERAHTSPKTPPACSTYRQASSQQDPQPRPPI